jgi:hypothetical protein
MRSKIEILNEIRKLARQMNGTPGANTFTNATGIRRHEWYGKHGWRNWGDLVAEAGLKCNAPPPKLSNDHLCESLFQLAGEVGRFPSIADMDIKREHGKVVTATRAFYHFSLLSLSRMIAIPCSRQKLDGFI